MINYLINIKVNFFYTIAKLSLIVDLFLYFFKRILNNEFLLINIKL